MLPLTRLYLEPGQRLPYRTIAHQLAALLQRESALIQAIANDEAQARVHVKRVHGAGYNMHLHLTPIASAISVFPQYSTRGNNGLTYWHDGPLGGWSYPEALLSTEDPKHGDAVAMLRTVLIRAHRLDRKHR